MRRTLTALAVAGLVTGGIGAGYAFAADDPAASTDGTTAVSSQTVDMDAMHAAMHAAMADTVSADVLAACDAAHVGMAGAMGDMGMGQPMMGGMGMDGMPGTTSQTGAPTMPMGDPGGHASHHGG